MTEAATIETAREQLVLCLSDDHIPGWSLHAPGSTDEDIATGDAPYILSGPEAEPTDEHYLAAWTKLHG